MPIAAPEFNSAPSGQPRRLRRWLHLHGPHQSAGDGPGVVPRAREFPGNTRTPRHLTKSGVQVGLEEGDRALLFLVRKELREGHPGGVVDADVDEPPPDAPALVLTGSIAGDAMADAVEA